MQKKSCLKLELMSWPCPYLELNRNPRFMGRGKELGEGSRDTELAEFPFTIDLGTSHPAWSELGSTN
ncbi:hypothetical protein ATANTOWER_002550 [Ataeniobius toweri]|uniref:Uncharacterized protein n=1 Tax=Ataeniobius toweri TaxID=208326 RepID=A0ABU7BP71_9TELE|nr:hypothetical protein [Ataeniobius toweri]